MDLGFIHRPLFAAGLWAMLTLHWQPAIGTGIFFELLWLDLFPAGTFIPPNALFALTMTLSTLSCLDAPDMRMVSLVLATAQPLAYLSAWIEQLYRKRQNLSYTALIRWNRSRGMRPFSPKQMILKALIEQLFLSFCLFFFCSMMLLPLLRQLRPWLAHGSIQPTWAILWTGAAVGAILALRIRKAYAIGVACLALALLAGL